MKLHRETVGFKVEKSTIRGSHSDLPERLKSKSMGVFLIFVERSGPEWAYELKKIFFKKTIDFRLI